MGAQISKTAGKEEAAVEQPAEGAAVAAKTNGQVVLWAFFVVEKNDSDLNCARGILPQFSNVLRQWCAQCSL